MMLNYFIIVIFNIVIFKNYLLISKIYNLYDYPDKLRKTHKKPTALFGGLVIFVNLILYCCLEYFGLIQLGFFPEKNQIIIFLFFSSLYFLIGFIDDKYSIKPNTKLFFYILLIITLVFFDKDILIKNINFSFSTFIFDFKGFSIFFTVLCFLLFINSFNMLDGINGQAASYSIYISLIFFWLEINLIFFTILIITLLFFLYNNFRNKMFLGDSGTILLGFVISYFFIKSYNLGFKIYSDEIFLIMMIPGFELVRLAIHRLYKKRHPFSPDNNHIHHLMIRKIGFIKSYILIQLLLFFPFIFYLIIGDSIISLLVSSIIYSFLIIKYMRKN